MRFFLLLCVATLGFAKENPCPFCRESVIDEQTVFESEYFRVLVDIEPRIRGHLLAVSKRHVMKAHELTSQEWEDLSVIIPKVVTVFRKHLDTDQYILLEKNGKNAFQQVAHVHFHLFPMRGETWGSVFNIVPERLSPEAIQEEVNVFRALFDNYIRYN